MEVPLPQFRLFGDPNRISAAFRDVEQHFLEDCSRALTHIADNLESQLYHKPYPHPQHEDLQKLLTSSINSGHTPMSPQEQGLIRLTRILAGIIDKLEDEAATEPLYSVD